MSQIERGYTLYTIKYEQNQLIEEMAEKEKDEEKEKSWMEKAAEKADREEGGRKARIVAHATCSKCGKEVEEGDYIELRGRLLCAECYEAELGTEIDMGAAEGTGAG